MYLSVLDIGSGRIDIFLADPDPFQPNTKLNLIFSRLLISSPKY
jgi:hypothetical protein